MTEKYMSAVLKRSLALAGATAAAWSYAGVVFAAVGDYPATTGSLEALSPTTGLEPGSSLTVEGEGFAPGANVGLTLFTAPVPLGSASADATGSFTTTVKIPLRTHPGKHVIEAAGASGTGGTLVLTLKISVGRQLPSTGTNALENAGLGLGALACGGLLVAAARRRTAA
jgi:LPXTG-motif cell wall-anchored protein